MDGLVDPSVELRSQSSAFEDELIMLTNDDATACKVSAIAKGYWKDPYYSLFEQLHAIHQHFELHKSPEINMGYYARVISMRAVVLAFIKKHGGKCNIVNLGCGFDTLPFWLAEHDSLPSAFVEVDLPLIVVRKMKAIRAFSQLMRFFPDVMTSPPASPRRTSSHSRPSSVILDATRHPEIVARTRLPSLRSDEAAALAQTHSPPRSPSPAARSHLATGEAQFSAPLVPETSAKVGDNGGNKPAPLTIPVSASTGAYVRASRTGSVTPGSAIEDAHMRIVNPTPRKPDSAQSNNTNAADAESTKACEAPVIDGFYHLVSCDIRSRTDLEAKLCSCDLDRTLPTLVIAECVLVYLTKEHSDEVLRGLTELFAHLQLLVFEQVNLSSTFGKIMIDNLDKRGWHLLGKDVCASEKTQVERLEQVGFETARCQIMSSVLKELEKIDGKRINRLEMLDERILLEQLLTHYALLFGTRGLELTDLRTALQTVSINDLIR